MKQATRVIRTAGLSTVSESNRQGAGLLSPKNLGATGAGQEQGVFLEELEPGTVVSAETANHSYRIRVIAKGRAEISGHEKYCKEPVLVSLQGTQWLDSTIPQCYVARGLQLQFVNPEGTGILTSPIRRVTVNTPRTAEPFHS